MKIVKHKWFFIWDFEKEERWLNDMAAQGLALTDVNFCRYSFEECQPKAYQLRLEMLDNVPGHQESQRYIKFLEETGAEYLGSVTRWVYFRKRTDSGGFDLFSDNASRIKHLNRMLLLCGILALSDFGIGMGISFHSLSDFSANLFGGLLCLGLSALLGWGFLLIYAKKRKLQKEQQLFE